MLQYIWTKTKVAIQVFFLVGLQREASPTDMVRSLVLPSSLGDGMCDIFLALPPPLATAPLTLGAPRQPQWGFGGGWGCSNNVKVSSDGAFCTVENVSPYSTGPDREKSRWFVCPALFRFSFTGLGGELGSPSGHTARGPETAHQNVDHSPGDRRDGWDRTQPERQRAATHPHQPQRWNTVASLLPDSQRETLFGPLPKQPDGEQGR